MRCTICFITCHHVSPQEEKRGTEKPEKQRQKQEERTASNGRKRIGMREWQAPNKKNGGTGGSGREQQECHETDKGKNCIMQSWERAVFSPRFLVSLYKTGRRFCMGDIDGVDPLGHHVPAKIPPSDVFGYCTMRRRSLRLLSPDRFHNSDGDTGAFFRVKNYRREFFARKPEA